MADKTLVCSECGSSFVFTEAEQEFYHSRGFTNEPRRCSPCRVTRREQGKNRQLFPVTCASCGKATEVPFQPRMGRPVYCSECYAQVKNSP